MWFDTNLKNLNNRVRIPDLYWTGFCHVPSTKNSPHFGEPYSWVYVQTNAKDQKNKSGQISQIWITVDHLSYAVCFTVTESEISTGKIMTINLVNFYTKNFKLKYQQKPTFLSTILCLKYLMFLIVHMNKKTLGRTVDFGAKEA